MAQKKNTEKKQNMKTEKKKEENSSSKIPNLSNIEPLDLERSYLNLVKAPILPLNLIPISEAICLVLLSSVPKRDPEQSYKIWRDSVEFLIKSIPDIKENQYKIGALYCLLKMCDLGMK